MATEDPIPVEPRIAAITRRSHDLDNYVTDLRKEQEDLKRSAAQSRRELEQLDATIERVASVATVPEMRRVMELDAAINTNESSQRAVSEQLEFWTQAEKAREHLNGVESRIAQLKAELQRLQSDRPSRETVIREMSSLFASVLSRVKFPALRDVWIDSTSYLPIVRGQHYGELSSRGAIALAVTSWHLAVLQYFSASPGLFPGLMILDSPLSNVGHDAADHEFRDQQIVNAFYALLADFDSQMTNTQLLVCDNRPPSTADHMVVVRFTGDPTRGRVGLVAKEAETQPQTEPSSTPNQSPTNAANSSEQVDPLTDENQ